MAADGNCCVKGAWRWQRKYRHRYGGDNRAFLRATMKALPEGGRSSVTVQTPAFPPGRDMLRARAAARMLHVAPHSFPALCHLHFRGFAGHVYTGFLADGIRQAHTRHTTAQQRAFTCGLNTPRRFARTRRPSLRRSSQATVMGRERRQRQAF
jgi:hypothetical protein